VIRLSPDGTYLSGPSLNKTTKYVSRKKRKNTIQLIDKHFYSALDDWCFIVQ